MRLEAVENTTVSVSLGCRIVKLRDSTGVRLLTIERSLPSILIGLQLIHGSLTPLLIIDTQWLGIKVAACGHWASAQMGIDG